MRHLRGGVRPCTLPRLAAPCEQLLRRKPMSARNFRNHRTRNKRLFNQRLVACRNHRRRPVPVITSSRRAVIASGLSVWPSIDTTRSPIQRSLHSPIANVRKRCGQNTAYLEAFTDIVSVFERGEFGTSHTCEPDAAGIWRSERSQALRQAMAIGRRWHSAQASAAGLSPAKGKLLNATIDANRDLKQANAC